jgi:hypothetical protein
MENDAKDMDRILIYPGLARHCGIIANGETAENGESEYM